MFGLGIPELIIILVLVLIVFGAGKLPEVGGSIGKAVKNFRNASSGKDEIDVTPKKAENKKGEGEKG